MGICSNLVTIIYEAKANLSKYGLKERLCKRIRQEQTMVLYKYKAIAAQKGDESPISIFYFIFPVLLVAATKCSVLGLQTYAEWSYVSSIYLGIWPD